MKHRLLEYLGHHTEVRNQSVVRHFRLIEPVSPCFFNKGETRPCLSDDGNTLVSISIFPTCSSVSWCHNFDSGLMRGGGHKVEM